MFATRDWRPKQKSTATVGLRGIAHSERRSKIGEQLFNNSLCSRKRMPQLSGTGLCRFAEFSFQDL